MAKKTFNPFEDISMLNSMVYNDYYSRLRRLALSMFEWKGLPEGMNARFLEKTLYRFGIALFIYDPQHPLQFMNTRCTPSGALNVYDEPVSYQAWATQYSKSFSMDECVPVRNNISCTPTDTTIMLYAYRLYEAEMTASVNVRAQKTPVLVKCDEKERLTLKNLYREYDGNEPFIFGDKGLNPDAFKVLKTDAPYLADKITVYKHEIWNECMTFLGINNANTDKKERLITDEAEANNQLVDLCSGTMLMTRQEAAAAANALWGTSISCTLRMPEQAPGEDPDEGGSEDE